MGCGRVSGSQEERRLWEARNPLGFYEGFVFDFLMTAALCWALFNVIIYTFLADPVCTDAHQEQWEGEICGDGLRPQNL